MTRRARAILALECAAADLAAGGAYRSPGGRDGELASGALVAVLMFADLRRLRASNWAPWTLEAAALLRDGWAPGDPVTLKKGT